MASEKAITGKKRTRKQAMPSEKDLLMERVMNRELKRWAVLQQNFDAWFSLDNIIKENDLASTSTIDGEKGDGSDLANEEEATSNNEREKIKNTPNSSFFPPQHF